MADVAPTTVSGTGRKVIATAGVAVAAGQWVYYDPATGTYKLADADAAATAVVVGVALGDAGIGENFVLLVDGTYNPGVTLTPGLMYVISSTAGAIAPIDDYVGISATGKFPSLAGRGNSDNILAIDINVCANAQP